MNLKSEKNSETACKMSSCATENTKNVFGDLQYFDALVKDEAKSLHDRIITAVEASPNPYGHLKAVTKVLVEQQSVLAARIHMLERTWVEGNKGQILKQPIAEYNFAPQPEVEVLAKDFEGYRNIYDVECTADGLSYAWTGPSPEFVLDIPVLRDVPKVFRLGFISTLLEEELLQKTEILIDGKPCQVNFDFDGSTRGIWCLLPTDQKSKSSRVQVRLSRTVSPTDIGKSNDNRRLGLAISGYKVSIPQPQVAAFS
ncbi:hypothetical protein [Microbulbifer mangrovi]|uniref:hypothetical protein n=1 Tax=Microbulbifer mangrovi TaxID=927787 RepID=UPI00099077B1|nr:hypothetical protein [Microbulbifer mangrovi]